MLRGGSAAASASGVRRHRMRGDHVRLLVIGQRQRRTREKGEPTGKSCFGTMFGAPIWVITAPSIGDEHRTTVGHAGVGAEVPRTGRV